MKALFPLVLCLGSFAPSVPDGPVKPHPVALRRERINRQLAHTRGRKGHR